MDFNFDSINLEELAGSETPIVDTEGFTPDPVKETTPAANADDKKVEVEVVDNEGIDLEALASAETPIVDPNIDASGEEINKDIKDKKAPVDKNASLSSQDTFTSLASALIETGAFSSLSEEEITEIKDVNSLLESIGKQIKQSEFSDLDENQKQYLEALRNGVPQETFAKAKSNSAQYKQIEDTTINESPALAKELIRRSFIVKGFDEHTAENYASLAAKSDTFFSDAFSAKNALVAHEEAEFSKELELAKADKASKLEQEQNRIAALKSKLDGESEILKGIKVTTNTKNKIFSSMTSPIRMDDDTPLNEVMASYKDDEEYKVRLHTLHVITKGFTDFSKITTSGKTAAVNDLEKVLSQQGSGVSGGSIISNVTQGKTSREIGEALKNITF